MPPVFPPPSLSAIITANLFASAVFMLSVACAAVLLWPMRKPRKGDGVAWVVIGFFATVSFCQVMSEVEIKTRNLQSCLLIWGVIAAMYVVNLSRLTYQKGIWCGVESSITTCVMLALLTVLFSPPLEQGREEARFVQCSNNLKRIGFALTNYQEVFQSLPAQASGNPPHSWRVDLLPYLDQTDLYDRYLFEYDWDDSANLEMARKQVWPYTCSSSPLQKDGQDRYYASYSLLTGPGTFWPVDGARWNIAATGRSQSALVVESCGQRIVWTEPRDLDVASTRIAVNLGTMDSAESPAMFSSYHSSGALILMTDGSVRRVLPNTDPNVLRSMIAVTALDATK